MHKVVPLTVILLYFFSFPIIFGEPVLDLKIVPEPIFNQVWVNKTYLINVTILNFNITATNFTGFIGSPDKFFFEQTFTLTGKGGYDFGNSTTGYSYNLDTFSINQTSPLDTNFSEFNFTVIKDSFEYGIKPYETIEIQVESDIYIIMDDNSKSPLILTRKIHLYLVDEIKSQYLRGKIDEMEKEIYLITELPALDLLKREKYLKYLNIMNNSLALGNYIEALDTWKQYDENDRLKLIKDLAILVEDQFKNKSKLDSIEVELNSLREEIETLKAEYEILDETYIALTNSYQKVNIELNTAKKNLSTSITAIFLSAIIFYFIGWQGVNRRVE